MAKRGFKGGTKGVGGRESNLMFNPSDNGIASLPHPYPKAASWVKESKHTEGAGWWEMNC